MKFKAISLLVALSFWSFPTSSVAQTEAILKFDQNKQVELARESVIYKPDAPVTEVPKAATKKLVEQKPRNTSKRVVQLQNTSQHSRRYYPASSADKESVKALIIRYSEQYGIDPAVPLCIAYHESGYNSSSKNKSSSAAGVFQYLSGTWAGTDEGKAGMSVYEAEANVKAAIKYMSSRKNTNPWEVRNKCPKIQ